MRVVITGASSGLGEKIAQEIKIDPSRFSIDQGRSLEIINWSTPDVDVSSKASVMETARNLPSGGVDVLINCAGVNLIDYLPHVSEDDWDKVMDTNAKGIFLVTQALLEPLRGGTVLNIVSNASHVPMTSSIAYNASKGAAAIMTRQMARELKKTHDITVFGISPNKLRGTSMSDYIERRVQAVRGWTAEQASAYQLAALPAGEETDPEVLAEFIVFLLSAKTRHKFLNGCILEYGA